MVRPGSQHGACPGERGRFADVSRARAQRIRELDRRVGLARLDEVRRAGHGGCSVARMLLTLRRGAGVVAAPDAVDLLLECHQRIRHFTQLAAALVDTPGAPAPEVAAAAASVLRYFTEALPKHAADEDESIVPRLLAAEPPAAVRVALASMTREHETLHEALAELGPRWRAVAAEPGRIADEAHAMRPLTARLADRWVAHLGPEESLIFPAVRRLLAREALDAILLEMRARRSA